MKRFRTLIYVMALLLTVEVNGQLHFHNPSFEFPVGTNWIMDPIPDWSYCIGTRNGRYSAANSLDTSYLSRPYGSPSHLYYFFFIGAKTYYNDAGTIIYPNAYQATLSNSLICGQLLPGHRYNVSIDACRFDDPPPVGDPFLNIFFGKNSCDTSSSIGGSYVSAIDWERQKFGFIATEAWNTITLRCEDRYLDSNIKALMEVSLKLDNLSPVTPDTIYNSTHFPISVHPDGTNHFELQSPYPEPNQYWYAGNRLLDSGARLKVYLDTNTQITLTLGKDSCISSVLQTKIEFHPADPTGTQLLFPNAFTPDANGVNDLFRPFPSPLAGTIKDFNLQIYNRWGQRLLETQNIVQGWNGGNADYGVYFWVCQYTLPDGKKMRLKGDVTLLR